MPGSNGWTSSPSTNQKTSRYRERYGCYPERILADKIYCSRQTLVFCKEHGIRLSGPALGKPPKVPGLSRQAKKLEYQDNCDRNAVEGVFGTVKTAYGLDRVMARLQETAVCVIGVALLLSNLSLSLRAALALFCLILLLFVLPRLRSRAYVGRFDYFGIFSGTRRIFLCRRLTMDYGTSAGINACRLVSRLLFIHFLALFGRAVLRR